MVRTYYRLTLIGLMIAAICVPTSQFEAAEQYTLEYRMKKGARFTIQVDKKHRNHRIFMGNELTTNTEELTEYEFKVKSSGDRGLKMELEYGKREYQSDDTLALTPPDFSELIGRRAQVLLSQAGVVSDFKGFDELPEIPIPGQDDPLTELRYINDVFGLFPRLPMNPVSLGESWSDVVQYEEPVGDSTLPLIVNLKYTLIERLEYKGHDCLKIEGEFTVNIEGSLPAGGLDLELKVTGNGTETVYFAWKKGMFLLNESHAILKGSADNEDMGVTIPMNHDIKTVTTVRLD